MPDRTCFSTQQVIQDIWTHLDLPSNALSSVNLTGSGSLFKSSFRIADLAQGSIALSALAAALVRSVHHNSPIPQVSVDRLHAALEFASERLYSIDGKPAENAWGPLSGLHEAKDGYVRVHDGFPNLSEAATSTLGLLPNATRAQVSEEIKKWKAAELEEETVRRKGVIYRLRTVAEWDATPQAEAISDYPVSIRKIDDSEGPGKLANLSQAKDYCLSGLRVLDLSRVIAAPVAGRTLAAHGADVVWVTSPNLPSIPSVDLDVNRGKKRVHLDLNSPADFVRLEELVKEADVLIQAYRPGALRAKGLAPERLTELRPRVIIANLSAWGDVGPWRERRGFDSIVQTVTGLNHLESLNSPTPLTSPAAKSFPVQALDHAAGYFLATGILAALYHRIISGGSYEVNVSLAAVGKYLRSLGQLPYEEGFEKNSKSPEEWLGEALEDGREAQYLEGYDRGMKAVRHAGKVDGTKVGVSGMLREAKLPEVGWP